MWFPEVELGAVLASRIKNLYYPQESWSKVVIQIGEDLMGMKKIMRSFYSSINFLDVMRTMIKFSDADLDELYQAAKGEEAKCKENGNLHENMSKLINRFTESK